MNKQYKAVLFDFGGIIINDPTRELYDNIRPHLTPENRPLFWQIANNYALGVIKSKEDFFNKILELSNKDIKIDQLERQYTIDKQPNLKLLDFVLKIKEKYKTGIVTNNGKDYMDYWIKRLGLQTYFDTIIVSAVIGYKKPDPQIYLVACLSLEVEPNECVFVDDNDEPLLGAKSLNMEVYKFKIDKTEEFTTFFSKKFL
ncbi:MAG: hypothetical protein COV26_01965 [Candidatus Nealsonbacteria bacterium CG10_big_fil_rev_8_21_14_0_10_36_23]|uniref:HAD family phosphatase n=1 Tax=Candidatus Nealsonbacteria bacterium CG10_big_fil_rev_8_21_14_0_10_36_23 TaxID=1974709 RepID=A0A2H0TKX1_9BACT|nr:MAG: hypothetical protein COV26_01965 [Candidatus Nealsonbacteria bacterium CG10_big_fil_rev_8_21_14_0_10_36_23]